MNRLVPYLDLFARLDDAELSRLADVDADTVATLRRQVVEVGEGLSHYIDLLPRLGDEELMRLTGVSAKTVRFWRLCQPRGSAARQQPSSEISSITPIPRPIPVGPAAASQPAAQPVTPRRRTTGVGLGAPATAAAPPAQPIADWSIEAAATNCATTVTPPPRSVPAASWDTTSPTAGTATMITPQSQAPAGWAPSHPSDMPTEPGAVPRRPSGSISESPSTSASAPVASESQQAAARVIDIAGEPFPGYERFRPVRDDEVDLVDVER